MRKRRITILLLALAGLVLASCDGGNGDKGDDSMGMGSETSMPMGTGTSMPMGGEEGQRADPAKLPDMPTQSLTKMGELVFPPGSIMTDGMDMGGMRGMAAVNPGTARATAPVDARGNQPLNPQLVEGVKEFKLETSVVRWNILPQTQVLAYAVNNQVPGPLLRLRTGDRVRILLTNNLPDPTTIHWHGLVLPNGMDGAAEFTQPPIAPGATFRYEFTAGQPGSFFYHSHFEPDRQQALGLYGGLLIDPANAAAPGADQEALVLLQEWTVKAGYTFPAMPMEGLMPNFFTINGKSFPATETINMKRGQRLLVRFIGSQSGFAHPMHIHGGPFTIVATDGNPVPPAARLVKDTVNIAPGERYDVIWTAKEPGKWLLHCHVNHHITNDGMEDQGAGGLTMVINVT